MAGINETRLRGMLGFAMRAGKLIIGTESVCRAMAQDTVKLVLVSFAASDGAKKKIKTKSEFYNLDCFELPIEAAALGNLIGKSFSPVAIAVTDEGFSHEIKKALGEETT